MEGKETLVGKTKCMSDSEAKVEIYGIGEGVDLNVRPLELILVDVCVDEGSGTEVVV